METYFPIFPFLPACEQVSEYRIAHKSKGCADAVQIDFPIYIYVYISIFWKRDETFQAWYRSSRCLLSMFLESLLKCCCSTTTFSVIQHPKSPDYGVVWDRSFHGAVPASSAFGKLGIACQALHTQENCISWPRHPNAFPEQFWLPWWKHLCAIQQWQFSSASCSSRR